MIPCSAPRGTKVIVGTRAALEAVTHDRGSLAAIAGDALVNHLQKEHTNEHKPQNASH